MSKLYALLTEKPVVIGGVARNDEAQGIISQLRSEFSLASKSETVRAIAKLERRLGVTVDLPDHEADNIAPLNRGRVLRVSIPDGTESERVIDLFSSLENVAKVNTNILSL